MKRKFFITLHPSLIILQNGRGLMILVNIVIEMYIDKEISNDFTVTILQSNPDLRDRDLRENPNLRNKSLLIKLFIT